MEEEINLRATIDVLLRHWYWIIGLALIAAAVAFVVSSNKLAVYEASSVVIVSEPRYQMQFDPRFETAEQPKPAYKAFPTLAVSDEVLQAVVDAYNPSPEAGIQTWRRGVLSDMASASSQGDPSLVVLSVQSRSSKDAAALANVWTDVLTKRGNEIFGESQQDVAFFEEQVHEAAQALDKADAALVEFEARNQASILEAQLESQRQAQADYLGHQRTISLIVQDTRGLREQLGKQPDSQAVSLADSLTALLLQIKAFNSQTTAEEAPAQAPIELQIANSEPLSDMSRAEQITFLDNLEATLQVRSEELDVRLVELQPQILDLQKKLQEMIVEQNRLLGTQELTNETYLTLARKLDEARISSQETKGTLQVGSYAAVPERPQGSGRVSNAMLAGLVGLVIAIVLAFAIEFFRQNRTQRQDTEE